MCTPLGVLLFELLSGQRPFKAPTRQALFHAILEGTPPDVRKHVPRASKDLSVVLSVAMAKGVHQRYRTTEDLAEDLRAVRESRPIAARRPSPLARFTGWVRRDPVQAGLVAALVLAMFSSAGFGGFVLAKSSVLREGERVLDAQERDREMLDAIAHSGLNSYRRGGLLEQSVRRPDDALPRIVEALLFVATDREEALRLVNERPAALADEPAFETLRAYLEDGFGSFDAAQQTESALDDFVRGWIGSEPSCEPGQPELKNALRHLDRAVLRSPRPEVMFHDCRARVLDVLGDNEGLMDAARAMCELWPEMGVSWFWMGRARYVAGDVEGAARAHREVLRLDESDLRSMLLLSCHEIQLGNIEESTRIFAECAALTLETKGRQAWKVQIETRVLTLSVYGHHELAARELRGAVAMDRDPELRALLGRELHLAGDHAAAVEVLVPLLRDHPRDAEASLTLCVAYEALQDWPGLVEELRRRVGAEPTDGIAWMNLAHNTFEDDQQAFKEAARQAISLKEAIFANETYVANNPGRYEDMVEALRELEAEEAAAQDAGR